MGVRLSDDEVWADLAAAHTAVFTTLRGDGSPVSLPVWFVAIDRQIYVNTPVGSKKSVRVRNDPRAAVLIESGDKWVELRAAHLNGTVEVVEDADQIAAVNAAIEAKYAAFRPSVSSLPAATRQHYSDREILRFTPEGKVLSWDNSRIRLQEGS